MHKKSDDPLRRPLHKPLIGISGFKVKKIVFRITMAKLCKNSVAPNVFAVFLLFFHCARQHKQTFL